jgi:hypothetical protein
LQLFRRRAKRLAARFGPDIVFRAVLNSDFIRLSLGWFNFDAAISLYGSPTWGSAPLTQTCRLRPGIFIGGIQIRR